MDARLPFRKQDEHFMSEKSIQNGPIGRKTDENLELELELEPVSPSSSSTSPISSPHSSDSQQVPLVLIKQNMNQKHSQQVLSL